MMFRKAFKSGSLLAATLVIVAGQEPTSPTLQPSAASASRAAARPAPSGGLVRGWPSRTLALPSSVPAADRVFIETGRRAINPDDYVCTEGSPVIDVLNAELDNTLTVEPALFFAMYNRFADLVPTYEALFFQTTDTPQTFGYSGEFTKVMTKSERKVKGFWDIPSDDIQVLGMHGTMLLDTLRTYQTYLLFGFPDATSRSYARTVRDALLASTTMNGGNYAFWTFNSVSFRYPGVGKKIVMGDGIVEAYAQIGFADVAPQAIFAHEYAHQIQYEKDYFDDLGAVSTPEATRYSELMADAMAGYYLTHARGEALNKFRVQEFLQVFFQIGDCAFDNDGHHGTPNQRMKAAQFGFAVADEYQKQGHILTAQEFHDLFLAYYPTLIAPDAF
jgi:hypothetical protein